MLKPEAAWPFPAKEEAKEVRQIDLAISRLKQLEETEHKYNWLMDCARKTGVIVTFKGDTMSVVHGTTDGYDDLLNACKAVDADIELTGKVSAESIDMVRVALKQAEQ